MTARRLCFALGLACGAFSLAAAVAIILALASNSGAGWRRYVRRHTQALDSKNVIA